MCSRPRHQHTTSALRAYAAGTLYHWRSVVEVSLVVVVFLVLVSLVVVVVVVVSIIVSTVVVVLSADAV